MLSDQVDDAPATIALLQMAERQSGHLGAGGRSPGARPHDLRRTCAKLCRAGDGELEQIQLLLGNASVQTSERYLGTKQDCGSGPRAP